MSAPIYPMAANRPQTATPPVVLITGSSSGIGLALLRLLAGMAGHYRIVATARASSLAKIGEAGILESENLLIRPLDVTSATERVALIREIEECWDGVDILVNNAGISYRSVVEHMAPRDVQLQFDTNFIGPTDLIRLVLPGMRRKKAGRIINISSVGGMMAMPTMGVYSASKFALEGISEALYYEMIPWKIKVTLIQPGFVRSNSFKNVLVSAAARTSVENSSTYANYYYHMGRFIARLMNRATATPEKIAKRILRIMRHPDPPLRVPASIDARFFSIMTRLIPRRLYHRLLFRSLPGVRLWATGNHDILNQASQLDDVIPARKTARNPKKTPRENGPNMV